MSDKSWHSVKTSCSISVHLRKVINLNVLHFSPPKKSSKTIIQKSYSANSCLLNAWFRTDIWRILSQNTWSVLLISCWTPNLKNFEFASCDVCFSFCNTFSGRERSKILHNTLREFLKRWTINLNFSIVPLLLIYELAISKIQFHWINQTLVFNLLELFCNTSEIALVKFS